MDVGGLLATVEDEPDTVMHEHRAHYGHVEDTANGHISAEEMDEKRKQNTAYEYLCHLEEAKKWIESCVAEELPPTTELEENLQNGVYLAKLAHFFAPEVVPLKRIYDRNLERYKKNGLHYRHTDNVVQFFGALSKIGLPQIFYPDTADVYDRKNMPKLVYCIHALSLFLFKLGLAPQIQDLIGKIDFTEEEISAMRQELEKYGIQMPSFSKIGGILANEMPVDEAAMHAAIIAINESIDKQDPDETLRSLQNPAAHLVNASAKNAAAYQSALHNAKHVKSENARNKLTGVEASGEADVYDELLTQAEVQGNINRINVTVLLEDLDRSIGRRDSSAVLDILYSPMLSLHDVVKENKDVYMAHLFKGREEKMNNFGDDAILEKPEVQQLLTIGNQSADVEQQKRLSVVTVNQALQKGNTEEFFAALQNPKAAYPAVYDFAVRLYFEEFRNIKEEKGADLDYEEICGGVTVLSAVASINKAVDNGDAEATFEAMEVPQAHVSALYHENSLRYQKELTKRKNKKALDVCQLLTHGELQEAVDVVNEQVSEEHDRIEAVQLINQVLDRGGDAAAVLSALQQSTSKLSAVEASQAPHYTALLLEEKAKKAELTGDPSVALWWEDIQKSILKANMNAEEGNRLGISVAMVNLSLDSDDEAALLNALNSSELKVGTTVVPVCAGRYFSELKDHRSSKSAAEGAATGSGWLLNHLQRDGDTEAYLKGAGSQLGKDAHCSYFNVRTMQHAWSLPEGELLDDALLNHKEIQGTVAEVTKAHHRELYVKTNEGSVVKIQSYVRGHLAQRKYKDRLNYLKSQEPAARKIQAWYKGQKQQKKFKERLDYLNTQEEAVVKLQALCRMRKAKKAYQDRVGFLKSQEANVIKIQAAWRSNLARHDYKALMHGENPPIGIVRKFVHLLDQSDIDYAEEIEIQNLRQKVVTLIRSNRQLETDLDAMDIKIGLLVKNRISIEEVVYQEKKLKKHKERESVMSGSTSAGGVMGLSKESHDRLDAYQHLFYLLQTNPVYLAKLLFEMPQSRSNTFMESVILTLYNYASNPREEYLLLKLFATSLEEEIRTKLDKMNDIVVGNPLAIKMVVSFNRSARGQSSLRDMLSPLVKAVLDDKNVKINTNPIEVYKNWVNQMESETGQRSTLPYDATYEEAIKHEEVMKKLDQSIQQLQHWSERFLSHILLSMDKLPYGMRYISKVMFDALHAKFPDAAEKEILKIVGNLLYYRYINSAIVAPDAFDVIEVSAADKGLNNDQRRNLGSIAKILQFAAANKGFGGDSQHLACLNNYIKASHDKFKAFFREACNIEPPEVRFNIDQYTDATMVTKPTIQMSVGELLDTHHLLLLYEDKVAPDHADPLHAVLAGLGDKVPTPSEFLGASKTTSPPFASTTSTSADSGTNEQLAATTLAKTEISLTLAPKFDIHDDDKADLRSLLIRTKRMTIDVVRSQHGDTLAQVLDTPASRDQEREHAAVIERKEQVDKRAAAVDDTAAGMLRNKALYDDQKLTLEQKKKCIRENLQVLVKAGLLSEADHHQQLISLIAQDIRSQRRYRQTRKQDLVKLRAALESLAAKRTFFESQADYYNQYVRACLDNLVAQRRKSSSRLSLIGGGAGGEDSKEKKGSEAKKRSIKYSAAKLHEKGIILEIESLPANQFKNVQFEISTTSKSGVFDVHAKFMGIATEKYELKFQDLLQLQYEGVAMMEMFDRAKVNVNLLIYLLNAKFYGRQ